MSRLVYNIYILEETTPNIDIPTTPTEPFAVELQPQTAQVPVTEPLATVNPEQPAVETVLEPEIVETDNLVKLEKV